MVRFIHFFLFFWFGAIPFFAQNIDVLNNESDVSIEKMHVLNTNKRECNLSLMPNGNVLYFMSTRAPYGSEGTGDGDIYRSNKEDGQWCAPEYLNQINTRRGEDEPSVSYDGEKIYFQSWRFDWESTGGPYYEANLVNGILINIKGLGDGINQFFRKQYRLNMGYATDGMAISPDGNLFIVACGSNYNGNMDLYYSVKKHGMWSFPQLLDVSTLGNERSVYIAPDQETIYFSSDGHGGFGGLDILKTTWDGTKTGEVVNIGEPFNTKKDDMGFVISGGGEAAFFIRDLDIYYADLNRAQESLKPKSSALIYGQITLNNKPSQKTVRVMSKGALLGETDSDEYGKYMLIIPADFSEAEVFVAESNQGYERQSIRSTSVRYEEFEVDFSAEHIPQKHQEIIPIDSSETNKLETIIYFAFDEFDIANDELSKLKKILKLINPNSSVYIVGHTDHVGSNQYNLELSEKRAQAVKDWIIDFSGLNENQCIIAYKGESKVLNSGTTSKERSINRRVSVKLLNH